jgi:hypothetical protein
VVLPQKPRNKNLYIVSFTVDEEALRNIIRIPPGYRSAIVRRHFKKLRFR